MMRGARRGCVRLRGAVIGIDDEDDSTFTITTSSSKDDPKTFHFQTRDGEERERWVRALEDTIVRHSHARWDPKRSPPKRDFNRKVAEADVYLQLLIDQIAIIEEKQLRDDSKEKRTREEQEREEEEEQEEDESRTTREKYAAVLNQANVVLNSVKHTIVQLQIAKNTAIPVNGIYRGPAEKSHPSPNSRNKTFAVRSESLPSPTTDVPTERHRDFFSPRHSRRSIPTESENDSFVQIGIELGSECLEPCIDVPSSALDLPVPEFSYSSSDEDEDYYDAADEITTTPIVQNRSSSPARRDSERSRTSTESGSASGDGRRQIPRAPIKGDGSVDYDALYEEESEPEMDSMEVHGSVVTHLLSQVKIGMDLTKVALPTFILERRSLLEMYADYFAHPDLFVGIADMPTPKERMIQAVRWYLCSFHAGRKSGVAKKPYNPILGEIFRCHWDIEKNVGASDGDAVTSDSKIVKDGPVPWCREDQLSFVAEQVSHHPPVSAFYTEHRAKRITFCAHVWTKSKFLGLSIGVHNIGKGWISVLEHGEEYCLTFPNGYGRSILTVPWIELGGTAAITCAQTGYQATVEFITKPFYGGKKNRISCQITQPGEKKPFLTINGEWSGQMEAKWADGRNALFADVRELRTNRKLVKPVCEQEDLESRRVWRDVTVGLKINDMDKATAAKCAIEQKQRDEARIRKEANIAWRTKFFNETRDGGWIYTATLGDRLNSLPEVPGSTTTKSHNETATIVSP